MSVLLDVVKVEAKQNYLLNLEFNNGEKRVFDMAPFINKDPFIELKGRLYLKWLTLNMGQ